MDPRLQAALPLMVEAATRVYAANQHSVDEATYDHYLVHRPEIVRAWRVRTRRMVLAALQHLPADLPAGEPRVEWRVVYRADGGPLHIWSEPRTLEQAQVSLTRGQGAHANAWIQTRLGVEYPNGGRYLAGWTDYIPVEV
jgi:hypothetical protein